jgi:ribosomal-protein-alanine N-acetyltransferase
MNIVAAGPLAADVFAALHAEAFELAWSASAFHGMLLGYGAFGLLATEDERPLGMLVASSVGDNAEVLTIAVSPRARQRGLGRALMTGAEREARARGAHAIVLDVAIDNQAGRALYAGLGFAQIGVRSNYYQAGGGPPRDALVLRKDIAT